MDANHTPNAQRAPVDNIVQDDFDPVAAMAQFEEMDKTVGTADAFIASMQADGVWEKYGDKQPAGIHNGIPVRETAGFTPGVVPWQPTYTPAFTQPYTTPHRPSYNDDDAVPQDADDRQNEIMEAISNLEAGVDACADAAKSNATIGNFCLQKLERLTKENMVLCQHIITIESIVSELQSAMTRLTACISASPVKPSADHAVASMSNPSVAMDKTDH
jgi:hypothetical protein